MIKFLNPRRDNFNLYPPPRPPPALHITQSHDQLCKLNLLELELEHLKLLCIHTRGNYFMAVSNWKTCFNSRTDSNSSIPNPSHMTRRISHTGVSKEHDTWFSIHCVHENFSFPPLLHKGTEFYIKNYINISPSFFIVFSLRTWQRRQVYMTFHWNKSFRSRTPLRYLSHF